MSSSWRARPCQTCPRPAPHAPRSSSSLCTTRVARGITLCTCANRRRNEVVQGQAARVECGTIRIARICRRVGVPLLDAFPPTRVWTWTVLTFHLCRFAVAGSDPVSTSVIYAILSFPTAIGITRCLHHDLAPAFLPYKHPTHSREAYRCSRIGPLRRS